MSKNKFFAKHAKSSAALVSLGIHAVLILVALSFVAVTVITKEEQNFEAKPVNRPKLQMKKLQVPVILTKKKAQKPKLRKRIVVQPKLNQNVPDIKMPEITGVKGGLGSSGDGLGGAGSLGFSMPEVEIFGIKGKGEKIVLILDARTEMMADSMGGIPAFTIIKNELMRIVDELPPTALFNVMVFDDGQAALAFPSLVSANDPNVSQLKAWLEPLNTVRKGMGDRDWGLHTLGKGGTLERDRMLIGKFEDTSQVKGKGLPDVRAWYRSAMLAQKMQADTIFVLTHTWDVQRVTIGEGTISREEWDKTSDGRTWNKEYQKALKLVKEENEKRRAAGQPPKAIDLNEWALRREYYPTIPTPPTAKHYYYDEKDFLEGFLLTREKYAPSSAGVPSKSGLKKKKKEFSFNIIRFVPKDKDVNNDSSSIRFKKLARLCDGEYEIIVGADAVEDFVTSDE